MTALAAVPRETPEAAAHLETIPLDKVDIGTNVRVDPGELEDLAASIVELGVLQPVKVQSVGRGRYRLLWGQRRVLASLQAGLAAIPAIVERGSAETLVGPRRSIEQLAENLQRKDLNAIEEAVALREVLDADPELTQAALAQRLGRSAPWVSNTLRLLEADDVVQAAVRTGAVSASHAKVMVTLPPTDQRALVERVTTQDLSSHDLEREIKWKADAAKEREAKATRTDKAIPKAIAALEAAGIAPGTGVHVRAGWTFENSRLEAAIVTAGWPIQPAYAWDPAPSAKCDCQVSILDYSRTWSARPGCVSDRHRDRQRNVERHDEIAREKRNKEREAELAEAIAGILAGLAIPTEILALMVTRSYHDWPEQLAGAIADPAATRSRAGRVLVDHVSPRYAYGGAAPSADAQLEALLEALRPTASSTVDDEPVVVEKPIRKAKATPAFTASQLAAARSELDLDGAD